MRLHPRERTADEMVDIYGASAVGTCSVCAGLMPRGYPLWGVHLHAALVLHSAHRAVETLAKIPAMTGEDRVFGRRLAIVDREST